MIYLIVAAIVTLIASLSYLIIKPEKESAPPTVNDPTISIWWDDEDRAHTEGEI